MYEIIKYGSVGLCAIVLIYACIVSAKKKRANKEEA